MTDPNTLPVPSERRDALWGGAMPDCGLTADGRVKRAAGRLSEIIGPTGS